jgi:hypothetical protein
MFRKMTMWAVTALLVVAFAAPMAFAASSSERYCEDVLGGTYTKSGSESGCVVTTTSTKNDKFSQQQETTGQGNIGNKTVVQPAECSASNPGNSCPKGQF